MNIANLMLTSLALALSVGEPRDRAGHTPITVKSLSAARMFGTRKFRHSSNITAIAFSWNGTSIAAGGSDGAIRLWNAASGESVAEIPAHGGPLTSLCFSGDGKLLASSCQDNKIRLWDTSCWKKVSEFAGDGSGQVLVSPSNLLLAYISFSGWVRVWDIRSGMEKWAYGPGRNSATSGSFSFSGDVLAIGIQGEAPLVWELRTNTARRVGRAPAGNNMFLAISPDGRRIYVLDRAGPEGAATVNVWQVDNGKSVRSFTVRADAVYSFILSPDEKQFTTISVNVEKGTPELHTWSASNGASIAHFPARMENLCAAYSPDGRVLAEGFLVAGRLWRADTGEEIGGTAGHFGAVRSLDFRGDGRLLVSAGTDNRMITWDVTAGICASSSDDGAFCVAFDPASKDIFVGKSRRCVLRNLPGNKVQHIFSTEWDVTSLATSGDGRLLGAGCTKKGGFAIANKDTEQIATVRLWNVFSGEPVALEHGRGSLDNVTCVAISRDGRFFAAAAESSRLPGCGVLTVFDVVTGQIILRRSSGQSIRSVAFSPDGSTVAYGGGDPVEPGEAPTTREDCHLLQILPDKEIAKLPGNLGGVVSIAYRPDGKVIAVGSADGSIRLWRMPDRTLLATLTGGTGVRAMKFSANGKALATCHYDSLILLWNMDIVSRK